MDERQRSPLLALLAAPSSGKLQAGRCACSRPPAHRIHGDLSRGLRAHDHAQLSVQQLAEGELALSRGGAMEVYFEKRLLPEVSYRFCQLFLLELDFVNRLRFHQRSLRQAAVSGHSVMKYLDAEEGFCAGMGGLLCASAVRAVLQRGVLGCSRPMEPLLCDALLKRINPTDAAFFPGDNLGRLLDLVVPNSGTYTSWADRSWADRSLDRSMDRLDRWEREFRLSPARATSPARRASSPARSPARSPDRSFDRSFERSFEMSPKTPSTPLPDYLTPDLRRKKLFDSWASPVRAAYSPMSELSTQDPGLSMDRSFLDYQSPTSPYASALRASSPFRAGSASPGPSPALGGPTRSSLFLGSREHHAMQQTLQVMARQAKLDSQVEDLKSLLPACCTTEEVFAELDDTLRASYVSLSDVRRFMFSFGFTVKYANFSALVNELHLRRKIFTRHSLKGSLMLPDSLDLRDIAVLSLPLSSEACQAVMSSSTDEEARSVLYLLRTSEACPGCGTRAQRSADAAGCPSVTCPVCRTPFRCYHVAGDRPEPSYPLTATAKNHLYRLFGAALEAAEELERDRRDLAAFLSHEICGLCDVFAALASGRDSLGFSQADLRRAFATQGLPTPPGEQWDLLWRRFAAADSSTVTFLDFKSQLQPFL
ncbi:unnamed protein product [Effrenium voratum]|uniref:Uncharacterized protein n=1 Tax=Effrenium voratum TaxID=2562239 RepID=A0AA36IXK0_9DINO|nr:unnamed protein product [Effrenium voratum]CAJ1435510.1 unnamed protein product [Effrenium voratum]